MLGNCGGLPPVRLEPISPNRRNHLLVVFGSRSTRQSVAVEGVQPLVRERGG